MNESGFVSTLSTLLSMVPTYAELDEMYVKWKKSIQGIWMDNHENDAAFVALAHQEVPRLVESARACRLAIEQEEQKAALRRSLVVNCIDEILSRFVGTVLNQQIEDLLRQDLMVAIETVYGSEPKSQTGPIDTVRLNSSSPDRATFTLDRDCVVKSVEANSVGNNTDTSDLLLVFKTPVFLKAGIHDLQTLLVNNPTFPPEVIPEARRVRHAGSMVHFGELPKAIVVED